MASTFLTRTFSTPTNNFKWTLSAWIKRSGLGSQQYILQTYPSGDGYQRIHFKSDNTLQFDGENYVGGNPMDIITDREFTDVNGWYNLVVKWDCTQSTASDRVKIYINGVQETSFSTETYPASSTIYPINRDKLHNIGRHSSATDTYFNGIMSHVHFVDGTAYDASTFGSTDSTTGEWEINTAPTMTLGTNGFTILKDGMTITDQSANSNNWTLANGTLTKTNDCPSNVFATLNPLVRHQGTLDLGNLRFGTTGSWRGIPATIGVSKGKWYWEFKQVVQTNWSQNGIMSSKPSGGYSSIYSTYVGNNSGGLALNSGNGDFYHDGSSGPYSTSAWFSGGLSAGDIISVALDVDAGKIWFGKNGTWGNSSNPATGSNGIDFSGDADFTSYKPYFPACSVDQCECAYNFGNGYFGTSAITTNSGDGYSDADGKAKFNYEVPTNFKAITTRGLNL